MWISHNSVIELIDIYKLNVVGFKMLVVETTLRLVPLISIRVLLLPSSYHSILLISIY